MALTFSLSPAGELPLYRQIVQQVRRALHAGQLKTGAQLPAVRALAESLVVNPNTVARAYQELIRDGWLESRAGLGVFVAERRQVLSAEERRRRLRGAADALAQEALGLDFTLAETQEALQRAWPARRE